MRRSSNSNVGLVSFGPGTDKKEISWCAKCAKAGVNSPLKNRIYLNEDGKTINRAPPADSKSWKQCWTCGDIVGVYAAQQEVDIMTLTEPSTNPFNLKQPDNSEGQETIQTDDISRKFDRTEKRQQKKKFKQDLEKYKNQPESQSELRKGAKLLSYSETK